MTAHPASNITAAAAQSMGARLTRTTARMTGTRP